MIKKRFLLFLTFAGTICAFGQEFNMVTSEGTTPIVLDRNDPKVVEIAAKMFASDCRFSNLRT